MGPPVLVGSPAEWYDRLRSQGVRLLAELAAGGLEILAAGWVRTDTDSRSYLYVVTPWVELGRAREGYRLVQSAVAAGGASWRSHDFKLVSPSHWLADGLVGLARGYADPAGEPVTFTGDRIGLLAIEGPALIYPTPKPAPAAGD